MKNVREICQQDLRNIKRVPLVGVLLIGLAILPSLYAWFNLSASWDPYSNTQGIDVAVVNEDIGAELDGDYLNVGEQLEENLSNNDDFGWTFVTREEAEKGVEYGDYYASVYIDETFSEELASVVSGEPQAAEIHYQVNEKVNAIAPKMTDAGASAIVTNMNEEFIAETTKTLFQEFDRLGLKLEEELPTFRRMKQVIYDLENLLPEVNEFADGILTIEENWNRIEGHANQFLAVEEVIPEFKEGTEQILILEKRMPEIAALGDDVLELEQTIPTMEDSVEEMLVISDRFSDISVLLEEALDGTQMALSTIQNAQEVLPDMEERAESIEEYMEALQIFIDDADGAAKPVLDTLTQQVLFANQTVAAIDQILEMIEKGEKEEVEETLNELNNQLTSHLDMIDEAIEMYILLNDIAEDESLVEVIAQLEEAKETLETLQVEVQHALEQLEAGEVPDSEQISSLRKTTQAAEQRTKGLSQFLSNEGEERIEKSIAEIQQQLDNASDSFEESYETLHTIEDVLINAEEITVNGEENISEWIKRMPEVEAQINEAAAKIENGLPVVIEGVEKLSDFIREDFPVIEERVYQVSDIIREDLPGMEEEYLRLSEILEDNLPQVEESINELALFIRNDFPEMEENLEDASDLVRELEEDDQLNEAIKVLRNDLDEESEFFSNPVQLSEEKLFPIPNYGSANAPFYTTLSLWVGALLLSNLISTNLHSADKRPYYSLRDIYLGRMILFLIIALLQGLIVSIGNLTLLGVYAANPLMYILFSVIIALIFMTMVYTLASILGNIGKAIAIILLVLQLSGGGGMFPIEVAPSFFQQINPYLPFTYAINLLREAVGGVIVAVAWKNVIALTGFWLLTLAIGLLLKPRLQAKIEKTLEKSKSSRLVE
ncbi:YhgE/Pip domain-containing protein [Salipaludibacillus daqingensis]|uniref:YhgE/Pip domain-containing protein n=1 Tax=Salipaludibacillus daqingensis TaxID=3041001 RepID=UPI002476BE30|nr:YhgE/Pip domain-containing protein [Salipaludibacillus daqingensis]